jgi:hypothetical protein
VYALDKESRDKWVSSKSRTLISFHEYLLVPAKGTQMSKGTEVREERGDIWKAIWSPRAGSLGAFMKLSSLPGVQ